MRKPSLAGFCLAALAVVSCAAPASGPPAFSTAAADAIRAVSKTWVRAAIDTAWSTLGSCYAEDAILLPPSEPMVRGRAAIVAYMRAFPPVQSFEVMMDEIDGRQDLAYAVGRYRTTLLPPGMAALSDSGKFVEVWKKQPDGSWKILRDSFSSDIAPAASAAQ